MTQKAQVVLSNDDTERQNFRLLAFQTLYLLPAPPLRLSLGEIEMRR